MSPAAMSRIEPDRPAAVVLGALGSIGAALIYVPTVPAVWAMSAPYAVLFGLQGAAQLGTGVWLLVRPTRVGGMLAVAGAILVILLFALARVVRVLPDPDPWLPVNSTIGFTDTLCAVVELASLLSLSFALLRGRTERAAVNRGRASLWRRALTVALLTSVVAAVALIDLIAVFASTDGFTRAGLPAGHVQPRDLPAGQMSTVEYCRPEGAPLAMDLYMPALDGRRRTGPAPVALYVHGGGPWGGRKTNGAGATLANSAGALFGPLRQKLNGRGFVVASIDYRLPPGTPWPAQIEDTKCAVRFLRAHAADLGIDPARIGVWGSSGGGVLASLLGLTGTESSLDVGQYLDQPSRVQAVVDMFGPPDLNALGDPGPFFQFVLQATFGGSAEVRRAASPMTYVAPGAPPFLILQGTEDPLDRTHQSQAFLQALRSAGVSADLVSVSGAGHGLNFADERPSAGQLTADVVDFFSSSLQ